MSEAADQPSDVMNNFTPRAQLVLANARREAEHLDHNFVGTEHLLLGLISLGQGVAVNVLQKLGLNLEETRAEVKKQALPGSEHKTFGNIAYTPRVKKVLALAAKEAKALRHTYVGTEHILLGLLQEGDGVAARVLQSFKVDIAQTRQEILKELDPNFGMAETKPIEVTAGADVAFNANPSQQSPGSKSPMDQIDTSKRYDVYCAESRQEVVYRNARFVGRKALLPGSLKDFSSDFMELEQEDGKTIFIARASVIKFCEHSPKPEGQV